MLWFIITASAYLFGALANVGDKFLLGSKRISSAPVYAFYIGIFGLGAFLLAPFGLTLPSGSVMSLCLISGALFLCGVMLLYFAIERAEASRVVPVVGAAIPLASFVLAAIFNVERLSGMEIFGAILLIFGGLLISFDLPLRLGPYTFISIKKVFRFSFINNIIFSTEGVGASKRKFFSGFYYALSAGTLMAAAYLIFKFISGQESFITWYVWTRFGGFLGVLIFFLVPKWRKAIRLSFSAAGANKKQAVATSGIFIGNKVVGGLSTLMLNYAITLGSVTLINSLVSLQYIFVLLIAGTLSRKNGHIFQEKLEFWDWAQKIAAIAVIAIGMFFISRY